MCALFSHLNISVVPMNDLRLDQLMWMIVMMKYQSFLASTSHPVNIFNKQILLCLYSFYLFYLFCIIQLCFRMNRSRESASQSLSINQSYLNYAIAPHSRIHFSSVFLHQWVMECLIQSQTQALLSNITLPIQSRLLPSPLNEDREGRSDQWISKHSYSSFSIQPIV